MVFEVETFAHKDSRSSFQRTWCAESFARATINFSPVQSSLSTNIAVLTLRGMHWQNAPHAEQKVVRCVVGVVWDVALDLRSDSPTFGLWHAVELSAKAGNALFVPRGVAHGFLTLTPGAVVEYLIDTPYAPEFAQGLRWNDRAFAIDWPAQPAVISDRDRDWPDFSND